MNNNELSLLKTLQQLLLSSFQGSSIGNVQIDDCRMALEKVIAAAPDVKDEPVAWLQLGVGDNEGDKAVRLNYPKKYNKEWWKFEPLYTHPSPRIAALEAEVVKLRGAITNHKADFITDRELYEALK